jgi:phenylacetate-CoA ligase
MSLQSVLPAPQPEPDDVIAAMGLFRRAAAEVPAYRTHLADHGVSVESIRTIDDFAAIPQVTKENYLRRHPLSDLVWHRDLTRADAWSASSGSSGEPTYWPQGERGRWESVELHDRIFRRSFRSHVRSTLVVVGFAMGNWIGGTYTYTAASELRRRGHRLSVIAPGMDVDTILANIAALGPAYEQVVLVGYPPFVKDVLDAAGPAVLQQDIHLLLAGEAISEGWRDYALNRLGRAGEPNRVCLIYGTADMGMIGHETPTTIAIRRAAEFDGGLYRTLFGDAAAAPTFVEYDPTIRFAELDSTGHLLYTSDGVVPLIRYRINDEGTLWTADELRRVLDQHGHRIPVQRAHFGGAYIALSGRSDVVATLYGLNIYPRNVQSAIEAESDLLSGKFRVSVQVTKSFEQRLTLEAELARGVTDSPALRTRVIESVVAELERTNSEYRELRRIKGAAADPVLALHEFGNTRGPKSRFDPRP